MKILIDRINEMVFVFENQKSLEKWINEEEFSITQNRYTKLETEQIISTNNDDWEKLLNLYYEITIEDYEFENPIEYGS